MAFHVVFLRCGLLAVDEDLPVGSRGRAECHRQAFGHRCQLLIGGVGAQVRARDDVAHDVPAGPERSHQIRVECTRERTETVLHHAVELDGLAGGESNGSVGDVRRHLVEREPLLARDVTARYDDADHEDVVERFVIQRPFPAHVAVVLGVDAVELHQLFAVARDRREVIVEVITDRPTQEIARTFDAFDFCLLLGRCVH